MNHDQLTESALLAAALRSARDTRLLELAGGARFRTAEAFASLFGSAAALVIADENTFAAAGRDVVDVLRAAGQACHDPVIMPAAGLYAEYSFVERLYAQLAATDAIAVAVGSGTINDLVKLASHQAGRPYLAVATAASMDGYTAYGASITRAGSKQTFECPAPRGVIADLDVMAAAPEGMNAAGYADLAAKCPAGGDWLLADRLGEEPIDRFAWDAVQVHLRSWMSDPAGVRQRRPETVRRVALALMMTGFAMQSALSSRPASGAEHQFSHLWDMQHHTHQGQAPSHGFKVGVGSLASLALYESLLRRGLETLDIDAAVDAWPDPAAAERQIATLFAEEELAAKAREETRAKSISRDRLRDQLSRLHNEWPSLAGALRTQLVSFDDLRHMLREAGAPDSPQQIGIAPDRLRQSYRQAFHIRRRFTVLDVACRTGLLEPSLDDIFSLTGGYFT